MLNWSRLDQGHILHYIIRVVILLVFLITVGCTPAPIPTATVKPALLHTATPANPLPSPTSSAPSIAQKLRVTNQSSLTIQHLVVRFPKDQIDFGEVLPGATTDYQDAPNGVYRFAAYDAVVNGKEYQQPVRDWVGETPMEGKTFTYILDVDPAKWGTEGQVILLVAAKEDQPTSNAPTSTIPFPPTPAAVIFPVFDRFQMFDEHSGWAIATQTRQILNTTDGGISWRDVTPAGLKADWSVYSSAYFLDAMTAWIPTAGKTFRTSDAGKTWQEFNNPFHLFTLQFIDHQTGWASADPMCGAGTCWLRLFQTKDGGQTWTLLNVNNPNGPETVPNGLPLGSLHILSGDSFKFSDSSTLWMGGNGAVSSPDAVLMVSRDQGQSWQKQNNPTLQHPQNSGLPNVVDLPTFLTGNDGYFAAVYDVLGGNAGANPSTAMAVYLTQDGGHTWTVRPNLVPDVWFTDTIDFVSLSDAFVRCGDTLCVTHDGAHSWQPIQSNHPFTRGSDSAFTAYDFVNTQTGWAIAPAQGENSLYETTDGGLTWTTLKAAVLP